MNERWSTYKNDLSPFSTWRLCSRDTKRKQESGTVIGSNWLAKKFLQTSRNCSYFLSVRANKVAKWKTGFSKTCIQRKDTKSHQELQCIHCLFSVFALKYSCETSWCILNNHCSSSLILFKMVLFLLSSVGYLKTFTSAGRPSETNVQTWRMAMMNCYKKIILLIVVVNVVVTMKSFRKFKNITWSMKVKALFTSCHKLS